MTCHIAALHHYPIKGLSAQPLPRVTLRPGEGFPLDRAFGFARPGSGFDPAAPRPLPKSKFLMLAREEALAKLRTTYDPDTSHLTLRSPQSAASFDVTTAQGRQDAATFLADFLGLPNTETPTLYSAGPHRFTDVSVVSPEMMNAVSVINLDSVAELSRRLGRPVDPARFRGNIEITGLAPMQELERVGQSFTLGAARLRIVKRTKRCPATQVNPDTALRDIDIPAELQALYGHADMGVYAEVLEGGEIAPGDAMRFE